ELVLCPVKVQGEGAAEQVVQAIEWFNRKKDADVLIVGRGGGSMEDLWAFNDEIVARAVAASSIPIISAVGHETDVTICDFVADCRAATPSAAAELAVPDQLELKDTLRSYQFTLTHLIRARMRTYHERLQKLVTSKSFQTPQTRVAMETMRLDRYTEQLSLAMKRKTEAQAHRLSKLSGQLYTLSPLQVLSRGYAITQDKNQQTIKSTAQVCTGQQIKVTLSDGVLDCTVDEVKCNE
ncbi:MAG: exodeoxyribonuclease VII large subunit, partial [Acutalibacteraceae bacterium]|nr:exodeoxyribonuclease VII large subunit [Acutalibacteraceae bacterium]